jgi:hypothetical protein
VGLDKYTIKDIMIGLTSMFNGNETYNTYKKIIEEV